MSDQNTPDQVAGGIFHGPDGKPSGRRIIGTLAIVVALGLESLAQTQGGGFDRVLPGAVCGLVGALLWGFVSVQGIIELIKSARGA